MKIKWYELIFECLRENRNPFPSPPHISFFLIVINRQMPTIIFPKSLLKFTLWFLKSLPKKKIKKSYFAKQRLRLRCLSELNIILQNSPYNLTNPIAIIAIRDQDRYTFVARRHTRSPNHRRFAVYGIWKSGNKRYQQRSMNV